MTKIDLRVYYQLGKATAAEGDLVEAEKNFDYVIANATAAEDKEVSYLAYLGKLMLHTPSPAKGFSVASSMLDVFSEDVDYGAKVLYDLAQFYQIANEKDQALTLLERLLNEYPDNDHKLDMHLQLGLLYHHHLHNVRDAIRQYTVCYNESDTNEMMIAINLADCYTAIGNTTKAKELLNKYLSEN